MPDVSESLSASKTAQGRFDGEQTADIKMAPHGEEQGSLSRKTCRNVHSQLWPSPPRASSQSPDDSWSRASHISHRLNAESRLGAAAAAGLPVKAKAPHTSPLGGVDDPLGSYERDSAAAVQRFLHGDSHVDLVPSLQGNNVSPTNDNAGSRDTMEGPKLPTNRDEYALQDDTRKTQLATCADTDAATSTSPIGKGRGTNEVNKTLDSSLTTSSSEVNQSTCSTNDVHDFLEEFSSSGDDRGCENNRDSDGKAPAGESCGGRGGGDSKVDDDNNASGRGPRPENEEKDTVEAEDMAFLTDQHELRQSLLTVEDLNFCEMEDLDYTRTTSNLVEHRSLLWGSENELCASSIVRAIFHSLYSPGRAIVSYRSRPGGNDAGTI